MALYERVGNLHIHTTYSDGTAGFEELAGAASKVGLDYLIVTDHNIRVADHEGWYGNTLVLVGEEVHDPACSEVNHLLALNVHEEMASFGDDPQRLVDAVVARGGIGFLAHPYERSGSYASEPEINWINWDVQGYSGLEIWNYMSEFKSHLPDLSRALLYAFVPKLAISGPYPEALVKWDELLARHKVYAIGGSDAHGIVYQAGPLRRRLFSYEHLFRAVNTHTLVSEQWTGDLAHDGQIVYDALARGRSFVGYDSLVSTKGFRFTAEHDGEIYTMGDDVQANGRVRFRALAPGRARLRLMLNGFCVAETEGREMIYDGRAPGAYRVEATRSFMLKSRGWIYSNPIFVRTERRDPAS